MARNKELELKVFLSAARKKRAPSIMNAPTWAIKKKGTRIYNKKQKRHWRQTSLGLEFKKVKARQHKSVKGKSHYHKGKNNRSQYKRKIKKVR